SRAWPPDCRKFLRVPLVESLRPSTTKKECCEIAAYRPTTKKECCEIAAYRLFFFLPFTFFLPPDVNAFFFEGLAVFFGARFSTRCFVAAGASTFGGGAGAGGALFPFFLFATSAATAAGCPAATAAAFAAR